MILEERKTRSEINILGKYYSFSEEILAGKQSGEFLLKGKAPFWCKSGSVPVIT